MSEVSQNQPIVIPVSGSYSIKEAALSCFLVSPIVQPERFESLMSGRFQDLFQNFETLSNVNLSFKVNELKGKGINPDVHNNVGFVFKKFDGNGRTSKVFQGINEPHRNFISFHSFDYKRWKDYRDSFKEIMAGFLDFQKDTFINATSMHYVDEFLWNSEEQLSLEKIFNRQSEYLPNKFFIDKLFNFVFQSEVNEEVSFIDRIAISVSQNFSVPTISISHNATYLYDKELNLSENLDSNLFWDFLEDAHNQNKVLLRDLLTPDILKLINLS